MKNPLLAAALLGVFAATSVFAQKVPRDDESGFTYPKDASVEQLLTFVENHKKDSDKIKTEDRAELFASHNRTFKMYLDIGVTIFEKNPSVEQVGQAIQIATETLSKWRVLSILSGNAKEYISYVQKFDSIFEQQLKRELPLPLKENILTFQASSYLFLGDIEKGNKKGFYTKAIEKADAYLATVKEKKKDSAVLSTKASAFLKLHADDKTPEFFDEYEKMVTEIEKLDSPKFPPRITLATEKINWYAKNNGKIDDIRASVDYIKTFVTENSAAKKSRVILSLSESLTKIGNNSGKPDFYDSVVTEFQIAYRATKNPDLIKTADFIDGQKRFINLIGNEMKIEGALLNGEKFDWEPFKGKVVLVDFWATWCGPCMREVPNMRANWDKYHDKGFEIIGLDVWDKTDKAQEYIEKSKTPWTILDDQQWITAGNTSIADYYGVAGIPCMVLIGRDGKVISTKARGETLNNELEKLFKDVL